MNTEQNPHFIHTGYARIREELAERANTAAAKQESLHLRPVLREIELLRLLDETGQAKWLIENLGTPPIPLMERTREFVGRCDAGELLAPEEIETVSSFLAAAGRLDNYLKQGCSRQISLAFYRENLWLLPELKEEIDRCIRGGRIDDYASKALHDLRFQALRLEEKIKEKADFLLRAQKNFMAESFVVYRNGRLCLPVKKEYKGKVAGRLIDKSATGSTLFVEPAAIQSLQEELDGVRLEIENEERVILYTLISMISGEADALSADMDLIEKLDFIFARGKLAIDMDAVKPDINTEGFVQLQKARHPDLPGKSAVPLDFALGRNERGMIITGPNTGGKTVAIKTVGLIVQMACSGLFVPCKAARVCMANQVLTDIGDGQNITDNLSTFSAHITNVIHILRQITADSLVLLDELGSGTDPAEGMGIAIAVLEELRKSGCLFLVTTHYPEVKSYGERTPEIVNARMAFDQNDLRPLYRLEIGKSGESCALCIARKLGMPDHMLLCAARQTYGERAPEVAQNLQLDLSGGKGLQKCGSPSLERRRKQQAAADRILPWNRGDAVAVGPENQIGIVVQPADSRGNVLVQIKKEKRLINHKRLTLKVAAEELYPEDYDFSILFDSVAVRKARHQMARKYEKGQQITVEEGPAENGPHSRTRYK